MVSKYDRRLHKEIHVPVIACFVPICSMHGLAVTTVEGLGSTRTRVHPLQEMVAIGHSSLCGFCDPGIVMSMYTLLRNSSKPTLKDIEEAFQGNLCRCGGYRPILEKFQSCGKGGACCRVQKGTANFDPDITQLVATAREFKPSHSTQEPIFPPELKLTDCYDKDFLRIEGPNVTWYRPTTLEELLDLKLSLPPDAEIIAGNTEIGLEARFKFKKHPFLICPSLIEELTEIKETDSGIRIGASATLAEVEQFLKNQITKYPEEKTRIFQTLVKMLYWFGSKQVRNVGTMAGNIISGSPVADTLPILMAIKAKMEVISKRNGLRDVVIDENYFTGYRKSIVLPEETILAIHIPFTDKNQHCLSYKQARKKEDDITIVHAAVNVTFKTASNIIEDISFGFGGLSYKVIAAPNTQKELKGLAWNRKTLEKTYHCLLQELALGPTTPGGKIQYRNSLILSLFFKMFLKISLKLQTANLISLDEKELSAVYECFVNEFKHAQFFSVSNSLLTPYVFKSKPEICTDNNALKQASGELLYCDDIPTFENELYMSLVVSTRSHAKILRIDTLAALQVEGVTGVISAEDVAKTCVGDPQIFRSENVTSQGQMLCGVVACDKITAEEAAKRVMVSYEDLQPLVITIEDAIEHESYFGKTQVREGDIEDVLKSAPFLISDVCNIGGQKHLYFESQSGIIVPGRCGEELTVYCSTETPTDIQVNVCKLLGVPQNKVRILVKKLGGSFGGKRHNVTWPLVAAVMAAKKFNRPVRYVIDHYDDAIMNGGRHPFRFKYKVAFDEMGKIIACDISAYCNGGNVLQSGEDVMLKALLYLKNTFDLPFFKAEGYICQTNLPTFTSFHGVAGPQATYAAHCIIHEIASHTKKDILEIFRLNFCGDQYLMQCLEECVRLSNFHGRRENVDKFNKENRYRKRGISIVIVRHAVNVNTGVEEKKDTYCFTYWAACSEVEIDTLTGDHRLLRTNIAVNLGNTSSSDVNIALLEGAFIQGYGLFVLEECVYSKTGNLVTRGPATYKIPCFTDIPEEFNVFVLEETANKVDVLTQEEIDEAALCLASSVFFAIKDAVREYRNENSVTTPLNLDPPATVEKVRLACEDGIIAMVNAAKA